MRAGSLFKLRCVGLDPSEDRRVVDLDSAVEEHEFQIAVGNIRYHRTAQRIASAVNCRPLKQLPRPIPTPARSFPLNHTGSPPAAKFATEPFRRSRAGSPRHFRYGRACRDAPVTALVAAKGTRAGSNCTSKLKKGGALFGWWENIHLAANAIYRAAIFFQKEKIGGLGARAARIGLDARGCVLLVNFDVLPNHLLCLRRRPQIPLFAPRSAG
jgi:hypothetical protein